MEKTKDAVLRQLEENYERACNAWVEELARMWDVDVVNGYWYGGEPGDIFAFDEELSLSMRDVKYIVRNGITRDQTADWQEYVSWIYDYEDYGFEAPTLREYVEWSVPLLDHEARARIDEGRKHIEDLKDVLAALCEEEMGRARTELSAGRGTAGRQEN